MTVMFDTCALIALVNSGDQFHAIAERCHKALKRGKHRMLVSVISAAEYGVKDDISSIETLSFRIPAFGTPHAAKAAQLAKVTYSQVPREQPHDRQFIAADTQIIAQAEVEQVDYILTRDVRTFARTAEILKQKGSISLEIVKLDEDPMFHMKLDHQQSFPEEVLVSEATEQGEP